MQSLVERSLMANCLVDPVGCWPVAREHLTPDDLVDPFYQDMFRVGIETEGPLCDLEIAKTLARKHEGAVARLARDVQEGGNMPHLTTSYVRMILDESVKRKLSQLSFELASDADTAERIAELESELREARSRLDAINHRERESREDYLSEIVRARIHARLDALEAGESLGIKTGIDCLDEAIGGEGFGEGEVIVVGAAPSNGKTLFVMQCLFEAAKQGKKCVFYSYEMGAAAVADRLIGMTSGKASTLEELSAAYELFAKHPAASNILFRKPRPHVSDLVADMQHQHKSIGATVFAMDYIGLIRGDGKSRYEQQSDVAATIQSQTSTLGVTTFLASQLSRPDDKTKAFIPRMANLRDSGQIEAAANTILLLRYPYRDGCYDGLSDSALADVICGDEYGHLQPHELFEVRVAKMRNGSPPQGRVVCKFQGSPLAIVDHREGLRNGALDE